MTTEKRLKAFLLLGVLLAGLGFSGCAPEQDPNAITFCDLPGVDMDNIDKISIYYGNDSKPIQTLDSPRAIAEFQESFEKFRLTKIDKYDDMFMTSSEGIYYTEEYAEAAQNIDTAYCIHLQLSDGTQWDVYVGINKLVYYVTPQGIVYLSAQKTEYIDTILKN